jgi:hypothetical protein
MPTDCAAAITWGGVQIVKFADGARTGENHFEEGHARDVVYLLRVELRRRVIHGSAPRPEIFPAHGSRFRFAADEPLKGV